MLLVKHNSGAVVQRLLKRILLGTAGREFKVMLQINSLNPNVPTVFDMVVCGRKVQVVAEQDQDEIALSMASIYSGEAGYTRLDPITPDCIDGFASLGDLLALRVEHYFKVFSLMAFVTGEEFVSYVAGESELLVLRELLKTPGVFDTNKKRAPRRYDLRIGLPKHTKFVVLDVLMELGFVVDIDHSTKAITAVMVPTDEDTQGRCLDDLAFEDVSVILGPLKDRVVSMLQPIMAPGGRYTDQLLLASKLLNGRDYSPGAHIKKRQGDFVFDAEL
jgi:hypothetical protein